MNWFKKYWQENKTVWAYILILFLLTRIILSLIGFLSLTYVPQQGYQNWKNETLEIEYPFLHLWAVWDSKWYLMIAENGYKDAVPFNPTEYSTIGFFPLYPATVAVVHHILPDYLLDSLLVSNLLLIISSYLLYKLIRIDHDEQIANRGLLYLFLFPSAYILSAIYPESMLLCLWLASILCARKNMWMLAGLFGFLAAFVKPQGFFIFLPLILIYLFQGKKLSDFWPITKQKIIRESIVKPQIIFTLFPIVGILTWGFCNLLITGDIFAYSHAQQGAWHHSFVMPFTTIYQNLFYGPDFFINSLTIILALIVLIIGYKKIPFSYWLLAVTVLLFNSTTGVTVGTWRYLASVFPFIIILALWGKSPNNDRVIITAMALLQGCFFVFWVAGYFFLS